MKFLEMPSIPSQQKQFFYQQLLRTIRKWAGSGVINGAVCFWFQRSWSLLKYHNPYRLAAGLGGLHVLKIEEHVREIFNDGDRFIIAER